MKAAAATRAKLFRGPRRRRAFSRYLRELECSPWLEAAAMDAHRVQRLRGLLLHGRRTNPHLRERMRAAGLDPVDVRSLTDLEALPPVSKAELLAEPTNRLICADQADRCMWLSTSGSTGEPFRFAVDRFFHSRSDAVRVFSYRQVARCDGSPSMGDGSSVVVELYSAPASKGERDPGVAAVARHIVNYELPIDERLEAVVSLDPVVLYGNRSHLLELADELERRGRRLPRLRQLWCSSEPVDRADRLRLLELFGHEPREVYGLSEVAGVAWQRDPGGPFSVVEPRAVVEVLRDGAPALPGQVGEIVVTSLDNHVMPFVRYRTGDLARLAPDGEPSGHAGMRLDHIEGRAVDTIRRADGRPVTYWALGTSAIWSDPRVAQHVRRWQVVQEDRRRVSVRIVATDGHVPEDARDAIREAIGRAVGEPYEVGVVQVPEIEPEANGKHRAVKVLRR